MARPLHLLGLLAISSVLALSPNVVAGGKLSIDDTASGWDDEDNPTKFTVTGDCDGTTLVKIYVNGDLVGGAQCNNGTYSKDISVADLSACDRIDVKNAKGTDHLCVPYSDGSECEKDEQVSAPGTNYHVLHNGLDVAYFGLGAGGDQVAGVDGIGSWISGEDLRGGTLTGSNNYGYKQVGTVETVFLAGGDRIFFPTIALIEFDGRNAHTPDVFTYPTCGSLLTSGVPYGVPSLTSYAFVLASLPSGCALTQQLLLPNNGLVPSSLGGSTSLIGLMSASLPVMSTGFYDVYFQWIPSAIVAADDIDGWWRWVASSPDGQQYWGMSQDELNPWQSQSVATTNGQVDLMAFSANLDYAWHSITSGPQTAATLAPSGFTGTGTYSGQTVDAGGGNPANPSLGFDVGRHLAYSSGGNAGVRNPLTGLANQDPAASPLGTMIPTLGFATWNNNDYDGNPATPPSGGWRLTWVQIDYDLAFGINPDQDTAVQVAGGASIVPLPIGQSQPSYPMPLTQDLFFAYVHNTTNHDGSGTWPDPNGLPSGSLGIPGVNGASLQVPLNLSDACLAGVPIGFTYGSSGLLGPGGPLTWLPQVNAPSGSRQIILID